MTKTVHVHLGERAYDIHIGPDLMADPVSCIPVPLAGQTLFILTDKNVEPYAMGLQKALQAANPVAVHVLALPPGEETKSMQAFEKSLNWMLDRGVTRKSVLFAVGGGVIGDLAGFTAATVLRGIPFVQIPTTLLSMVDSAVGGKTAIDMPQGKNLVGAFHQPVAVIADTDSLKTLPDRQMRAGYAEAVKHAVLGDADFFEWLEKDGQAVLAHDAAAIEIFVEKNCQIKAGIVADDEREAGRRALLNLGHTFGHALEVASGYSEQLLHGEAVSIGMVMALNLSARLGYGSVDDVRKVEAHLRKAGLPVDIQHLRGFLPADTQALVQLMYSDKKAETGKLNFILTRRVGEAFVQSGVAEADVLAVLNTAMQGA